MTDMLEIMPRWCEVESLDISKINTHDLFNITTKTGKYLFAIHHLGFKLKNQYFHVISDFSTENVSVEFYFLKEMFIKVGSTMKLKRSLVGNNRLIETPEILSISHLKAPQKFDLKFLNIIDNAITIPESSENFSIKSFLESNIQYGDIIYYKKRNNKVGVLIFGEQVFSFDKYFINQAIAIDDDNILNKDPLKVFYPYEINHNLFYLGIYPIINEHELCNFIPKLKIVHTVNT